MLFVLPARPWLEQRLESALLISESHLGVAQTSPIALVAIDEASIDALGPWPWPRALWSTLLDQLHAAHRPVLVALDAVFPPDPQQQDGNRQFGASLARSPAVIGQLLLSEDGLRGHPEWATVHPDGAPVNLSPEPSSRWPRYAGVLGSDTDLATQARVGHINAKVDTDGVMRQVPTLLCTGADGRCAPSFLQAIIAGLLDTQGWTLRRGGWHEAQWMLQPGEFAALALPLDADLMLTIPWRHPSGLRYLPATDIWHQRLPAGELDQHVLIFGGVSLGLGDLATSALHNTVPGMEVHAQTLRNWLDNTLPFQPRYAGPLLLVWTVLVAWLLLANLRHAGRLAGITVIGALVPLGGAFAAWTLHHAIWPAATPAVFAAVMGSLLLVAQALHNRKRLVRRFEAYLPAPLRRLLDRPDAIIPTETGWGTVMVADILGYTAQSQRLSLTQQAKWGDTAIAHVVEHAQARGAMLDNVAGDGVLLLWRTGTDAEQAYAAADTARAILDGLALVNQRLADEGLPPVELGIGVHSGPYLLGSFGSTRKRYTVVSEVANLAAHIERQTRRHPWPVLLSKTLAQTLPATAVRAVAELQLANGRHIQLYTLTGIAANRWAARDS